MFNAVRECWLSLTMNQQWIIAIYEPALWYIIESKRIHQLMPATIVRL